MNKYTTVAAAGAVALAGVFATTNTAEAQSQNCAQRDVVVDRLQENYGETVQSKGDGPQGRLVETWANESTGTWTTTVTMPNGITCLVASGQGYEELDGAKIEIKPEEEEPKFDL